MPWNLLLSKNAIKIYVIILIIATISWCTLYVKNLQVDNVNLKDEIKVLKVDLENKDKQIAQIKTDISLIQKQNKALKNKEKALKKDYDVLRNKFQKIRSDGTKRDLGALILRKPYLVEKIINNGTQQVNRCIEIVSGSLIVKEDLKNKSCPELIKTYINNTEINNE